MDDASRVGEARRHAAALAAETGLDDTATARLAVVVTELGNNLARHAVGGRLLIATIRCCGAGNVLGRVISGVSDRSILTRHGTAGVQVRRPEEVTYPWPDHALVIVHSDGVESRWGTERLMPVLVGDLQLVAAILIRDHCRGRDDATVVVMRRQA